jgi:signal transduction histidine kinase
MGTMIPGAFLRPYVLFPLSLWAALRFEARGAAWASFTVAVVALVATVARIGPFHLASRGDSLLTLQLYLAIFVATSLVLAAAAAERVDAVHAREDFISIASHELRTPLTPLSLQVERLGRRVGQGKALPEDLEPIQQSLARQVDRMTALVDVLLDVTRLRTGPMVLQRESLDLATLARETVDSLSDDLRRARCALSFEAPHPVVAEWDPTRMQQALINLLTNATKYAAGAPVAVSVSAEPSRARLVVRDGGPGIALGEQAVLFHRFARLPSAHRQGGGLGLGLYITRQIVEAHGGTIRLDSRPGQGATFTCTFPLDPQPAEGESLPGSPEKHG